MNVIDATEHQGGDLRVLRPRDGLPPLDAGTCVNTYGPEPETLRALGNLTGAQLRAHPYTAATDLRDAYLRFLAVPEVDPRDVLIGAGITTFLRILERLPTTICTIWPDYTETIARFTLVDGGLDTWEQRARRLDDAMDTHNVVVISNPQNPTGAVIPAHALLMIAAAHPTSILVVDEAYAEFLPGLLGRGVLGCAAPNVAVLRSPNKILGAAGLRVGMMWTRNAQLRAYVAEELPRWPISQADGVAACAGLRGQPRQTGNANGVDHAWIDNTRRRLLGTAGLLDAELREQFGDRVLRSPMHFRFVFEPDPERLNQVWTHFRRRNIAVRVFTTDQPGRVPGLRFVAPTAADWPRLADAIEHIPPP